jgi:hypothetical protein
VNALERDLLVHDEDVIGDWLDAEWARIEGMRIVDEPIAVGAPLSRAHRDRPKFVKRLHDGLVMKTGGEGPRGILACEGHRLVELTRSEYEPVEDEA